ncbi:MAG TPA: hypothetical protein VG733_01970 [Chthoniobacteraceae bacterium]|nr:hypothetical protein [Chthoniobacteraceae bacterium]
MRSLRIALLFAFVVAGLSCRAQDLKLEYPYGAASVTLTENGAYRIHCEGGPHPLLTIQVRSYDGYLPTRIPNEFKITYCQTEISDAEMKTIFEAALDTVRHFRFDKPGPGVMDGQSVTLDVESTNSIEVNIGPLKDAKDASPGIARIIAIADSYATKDWKWNKKLPAQLTTDIPPRNRKSARIAAVFKAQSPPTIKYLLARLGRPDGFSKQFWQTKSKGSAYMGNVGGTLLFLLDDGTEIHVWTPDFKKVFLAIHYRKAEDEESGDDVLFGVPFRRH